MYPQTSGYGWDGVGPRRLHFVGRTENLDADWRRLLVLAGLNRSDVARVAADSRLAKQVNRRSVYLNATLQYMCTEWRKLAEEPLVSAYLAADRSCMRLI